MGHTCFAFIMISSFLLLTVQSEAHFNGDRYRSTYHRVVSDTQEAHHLNVGGY